MPSREPRSSTAVAEDRAKIAAFLELGLTHKEIGRKLRLSEFTVAREIERMEKDWFDQSVESLAAKKEQALAEIKKTARAAEKAFLKSKRRVIVKTKIDGNKRVYQERIEEERAGDPRHLQVLLNCQKEIIALFELIKVPAAEVAGNQTLVVIGQEAARVLAENDPEYLEYLHERAIQADAGLVRTGDFRRPLEAGSALGDSEQGADGHSDGAN